MSDHAKISGAFDAFMADSGSNDKRDAVVIYRAPRDGHLPSASKDPTARLEYVKQHADRWGEESMPDPRSTAADTAPTSAGRSPEDIRRTESPLE